MSFLLGQMRHQVNGQKELTDHKDIIKLDAPSVVKIPLIVANVSCEVYVKQGDKVKVGTKIGARNDHFYCPIYSSVSGVVKGVEKLMHPTFKQVDHVVIENDGKYEAETPLKPMDFEKATHKELEDFVKNLGLIGSGGAGFPTFVKYMMPEKIDTLIINAVECEPYITSDYKGIYEN